MPQRAVLFDGVSRKMRSALLGGTSAPAANAATSSSCRYPHATCGPLRIAPHQIQRPRSTSRRGSRILWWCTWRRGRCGRRRGRICRSSARLRCRCRERWLRTVHTCCIARQRGRRDATEHVDGNVVLPGLYTISRLNDATKGHHRARRPSNVSRNAVHANVVRLMWYVNAMTFE